MRTSRQLTRQKAPRRRRAPRTRHSGHRSRSTSKALRPLSQSRLSLQPTQRTSPRQTELLPAAVMSLAQGRKGSSTQQQARTLPSAEGRGTVPKSPQRRWCSPGSDSGMVSLLHRARQVRSPMKSSPNCLTSIAMVSRFTGHPAGQPSRPLRILRLRGNQVEQAW